MESYKFQSVESGKYSPEAGIKILVVDPHPTRCEIASNVLRALGHEVVTATRMFDVLPILEGMRNKINLVLVEAHLPVTEIFILFHKMRERPLSLFLTANDMQHLASQTKVLCEGSVLCPGSVVHAADMRGIWRFSLQNGTGYLWPLSQSKIVVNKCPGLQPYMNGGERVLKRKYNFLQDFESAGIGEAPPNKIYRHMNVPQLTEKNVSSLQNHPLSLKYEDIDAPPQTLNGCSCFPNSRSNQHPLFLNKSNVPNSQKFLCNCMSAMSREHQWPLLGDYPQGVAVPTASGFGAFINNGNGDASQDITEVGDNIHGNPLKEFSLLYSEDGNFGAEKIIETLPSLERERAHQFSGEVLDTWLQNLASGGSDVEERK